MTRTEQLSIELQKIAAKHKKEIDKLSYCGPRGGSNGAKISGWARSTANITRAGGLPTINWWDGSNPTPSTGIPACCKDEAYAAQKKIFGYI